MSSEGQAAKFTIDEQLKFGDEDEAFTEFPSHYLITPAHLTPPS